MEKDNPDIPITIKDGVIIEVIIETLCAQKLK